MSTVLGCGGDATGTPPLSADQTFWALQFNYHAINLALTAPSGQPVVDTVHLMATPVNAAGGRLMQTGVVHYRSADSAVTVDSNGFVIAHFVTGSTRVIASLTVNGVTLTDTAFIQVVPISPPLLKTFSIQPLPHDLDSARAPAGYDGDINNGQGNIPVYATDAVGDSLCSAAIQCPLLIYFTSSNPEIATIANNPPGKIEPLEPGHTTLYATTLAYGVVKRDSLRFIVEYPINANVYADLSKVVGADSMKQTLYPLYLHVGIGAAVGFQNLLSDSVDVVLKGPRHGFTIFAFGTGNQDTTGGRFFPLSRDGLGDDYVAVAFTSAGTYTYHSNVLGVTGTIVVSAGP